MISVSQYFPTGIKYATSDFKGLRGTFAPSSTEILLWAGSSSLVHSHCEISAFWGHGVVHRSHERDAKMLFLSLNKMTLYNVMATGFLSHDPHTL